MQQKCVPQKNSQNRRLLWEALVEGNPPSYSDVKMTSGHPPHEKLIQTVTQKISSSSKGNHLLGRQWERALVDVDHASPCGPVVLKKGPT
ncbi:hypothetical protein E2C01_052668 [Portunus trituberculatus]|uniref:Uncharacterized protein n=1 Tax=Portunus trituberculatus TaxID=210409 RepID=A0A5B7GEB9_PORTR|nr:hypothetical protein [Portunus trituberculatus]